MDFSMIGACSPQSMPPARSPVGSTHAFGINPAGQIVGYYEDINGNHGFLDDLGIFTAIDAPDATLGGFGTIAQGINPRGQIVGEFDANGTHGFLATPN